MSEPSVDDMQLRRRLRRRLYWAWSAIGLAIVMAAVALVGYFTDQVTLWPLLTTLGTSAGLCAVMGVDVLDTRDLIAKRQP